MNITLRKVVPIPLKDRVLQKSSDVWNKDIVFNAGDWIKIKAPSGTGKTTLVHSLYKLRQDYEGDVLWNNLSVQQINGDTLAVYRQYHISIIFQDLRLFPNLTARENIEVKRVLQAPIYESSMIDKMAGELGVVHILEQQAALCSYGEQQRVAIIRALMQPFDWLIMDEPFSHLDEANTDKAVALIDVECKKRKAGLVITDLYDDAYFPYTSQLNL